MNMKGGLSWLPSHFNSRQALSESKAFVIPGSPRAFTAAAAREPDSDGATPWETSKSASREVIVTPRPAKMGRTQGSGRKLANSRRMD